MGMQGVHEPAVAMPDTYGLPVYTVTKIIKQRIGDEIHMLCGAELFGQTQWTFIAIMKAEHVIIEATEARDMALDAFDTARGH